MDIKCNAVLSFIELPHRPPARQPEDENVREHDFISFHDNLFRFFEYQANYRPCMSRGFPIWNFADWNEQFYLLNGRKMPACFRFPFRTNEPESFLFFSLCVMKVEKGFFFADNNRVCFRSTSTRKKKVWLASTNNSNPPVRHVIHILKEK